MACTTLFHTNMCLSRYVITCKHDINTSLFFPESCAPGPRDYGCAGRTFSFLSSDCCSSSGGSSSSIMAVVLLWFARLEIMYPSSAGNENGRLSLSSTTQQSAAMLLTWTDRNLTWRTGHWLQHRRHQAVRTQEKSDTRPRYSFISTQDPRLLPTSFSCNTLHVFELILRFPTVALFLR